MGPFDDRNCHSSGIVAPPLLAITRNCVAGGTLFGVPSADVRAGSARSPVASAIAGMLSAHQKPATRQPTVRNGTSSIPCERSRSVTSPHR